MPLYFCVLHTGLWRDDVSAGRRGSDGAGLSRLAGRGCRIPQPNRARSHGEIMHLWQRENNRGMCVCLLLWINHSQVPFISENFFGGHTSFSRGRWYPCFGLLVTSALSFKFRVDSGELPSIGMNALEVQNHSNVNDSLCDLDKIIFI